MDAISFFCLCNEERVSTEVGSKRSTAGQEAGNNCTRSVLEKDSYRSHDLDELIFFQLYIVSVFISLHKFII